MFCLGSQKSATKIVVSLSGLLEAADGVAPPHHSYILSLQPHKCKTYAKTKANLMIALGYPLYMVAMLIAGTSSYGKNSHPGLIQAWYRNTSNIPSPKLTAGITRWKPWMGFGNFSRPFKGKLRVFRKASSLFNHFRMIRGVPVLPVRRRVTTPLPGVK